MSTQDRLQEIVSDEAERAGVPGVAVGMVLDDEDHYAYHGVTSVEHPLPVDEGTLFQFGSTGKTFTASAVMRLVDRGEVDLDAPVRRYLPDFAVTDEEASARATVLNLLNHTAGWSGDRMGDVRDRGDDALARFVAGLADAQQEFPVGAGMSYNNASLSVAGRIIEVVTGRTYEQAMAELIFGPLGLEHSLFLPEDVMTHRFAVGHVPAGETMAVARPWSMPRGSAPAGGITANAGDLVRWIRFHLGDGTAPDGTRVLEEASLRAMQEPTVTVKGSALGDHIGISWMLEDLDGARVVAHGGSTIGQESAFTMVPERGFGITSTTNASGPGTVFNNAVVRRVREEFLGLRQRTPDPVDRDPAELEAYLGSYDTVALTIEVSLQDRALSVMMEPKQAFLDSLGATREEFVEPPISLGMVREDEFVTTSGSSTGMKGTFVREADGTVSGVHLGGRLARRVPVG
ncbi:hypothetical protein AVL62_10030 [Serinicoccus chungangensis]|uniref:Beta-lactamase-related domain-containing protein n=1 Tax=Serinicoccus chungangensis TaxID=767452 RepID=A0A0W8I275_9MICO|nr:serine hydrolase domain-containing protein [Serinicoccus chungangensis]KUG51636.1 hypothetical protein AVL62_10030 [Serinicoccus chungangensis]